MDKDLLNRAPPGGMLKNVQKLSGFIQPAGPTEEIMQKIKTTTNDWLVENLKNLQNHYSSNILHLKDLPENKKALQIALTWASKRYKGRLTPETITLIKDSVKPPVDPMSPSIEAVVLDLQSKEEFPPLPKPAGKSTISAVNQPLISQRTIVSHQQGRSPLLQPGEFYGDTQSGSSTSGPTGKGSEGTAFDIPLHPPPPCMSPPPVVDVPFCQVTDATQSSMSPFMVNYSLGSFSDSMNSNKDLSLSESSSEAYKCSDRVTKVTEQHCSVNLTPEKVQSDMEVNPFGNNITVIQDNRHAHLSSSDDTCSPQYPALQRADVTSSRPVKH